jgi:hypothetical protein
VTPDTQETFDPLEILRELKWVRYIVVGALGRVVHGSGEITDGVDIVPAPNGANIRDLSDALEKLNARRRDGAPLDIDQALASEAVVDLVTDAGGLKIIPEPAGTRGFDDLRRDAQNEPLGNSVRPQVASIADLARMLAALNREQDREILRRVRRMVELDRGHSRSRGWTLER